MGRGSHRIFFRDDIEEILETPRRERQLKAWRREKKVTLVNAVNPSWQDLAAGEAG